MNQTKLVVGKTYNWGNDLINCKILVLRIFPNNNKMGYGVECYDLEHYGTFHTDPKHISEASTPYKYPVFRNDKRYYNVHVDILGTNNIQFKY